MNKLTDREFLVIELQHIYLRCAIVRRRSRGFVIVDDVRRIGYNVSEALTSALAQLGQRKALPPRAIVVTSEALAALPPVEIPEGATAMETRELLRWEMEDVLAPYFARPSLNRILTDTELFPDGRDKLLSLPDNDSRQQAALESGLIDEIDLRNLQERLADWPRSAEDFEFHPAAGKNKVPAEIGKTLVTGLSVNTRFAWKAICEENNLELWAIVPGSVASLGCLSPGSLAGPPSAVISTAMHQHCAAYFENGRLVELTVYNDAIESVLDDLVDREVKNVVLQDGQATVEHFNQLLTKRGDSGNLIDITPSKSGSLTIQGAAAAVSGITQMIPGIVDTSPEPPPVMKRAETWWALAAAIILPFVTLSLLGKFSDLRQTKKDIVDVEEKLSNLDNAKKERDGKSRIHKAAVEKLKILQGQLAGRSAQPLSVAELRYTSPDFYVNILGCVSKELVEYARLESLHADYSGLVELSGRSISEESIRYGLREFYRAIEPWDIVTSRAGTSYDPDGRLPYTFTTRKERN
ncbi:MAG: hypothetical protein MK183_08270 [Verrucomicrobiales bacterium]|nr:hypothetical protein [Verrucomicrobiales bacterium]